MNLSRCSPAQRICRPPRVRSAVFLCLCFLHLSSSNASAAELGTLTGRVSSDAERLLSLATARIPDLGVSVDIAGDGTFRFDDLQPGSYLLEVRVPSLGVETERVWIHPGRETTVKLVLGADIHAEEIVVSASAESRRAFELATPTTSLSGRLLQLRLESSLGETLAQEPGIHSTYFGPGASQPVIRGLAGRRIRTLEGGIGTGDVSGLSADHAVTTEPAQAERIEVLRGPGTLLYGSSAIGGVVNVIDERVPTVRGVGRIHGDVSLRGGNGADERMGSLRLSGGKDRWAWNVAATTRETNDYDIPGFALLEEEGVHDEHGEHEEEAENPFGTVPNTDLDTRSARAGATYFFGDKGFLGVSVSGFDTDYGLPGGLEHAEHAEEGEHDEGEHEEGEHEEGEHEEGEHDEHEEGVPVRLDVEQRRFDIRGQIAQPFNGFRALEINAGATDYEHLEREGDAPGTVFFNNHFETRLVLHQNRRGRHSGSIGIDFVDNDLEAIGAEAFIPKTSTTRFSAFTLQEIETGPFTLQLGARFERQEADPANQAQRRHDGLSASLGVVWTAPRIFSVALSGSRSVRLPAAEELFADGLHIATQAFEIGDPALDEEVGLGLDLSLRAEATLFSGEVTFFRQSFSDYIFQAFTGLESEGFPVVLFSQDDATFTGFELKGRFELFERDGHHVHAVFSGDVVDADLDVGGNLPRIPPLRLGLGVHYHGDRWNGSAEVKWVDDQDEVAENETPTDGYTFLNASLGYRWFIGSQVVDILLRGKNLTDEEARSHTSFLKDVAPLPGRVVTLSAQFRF